MELSKKGYVQVYTGDGKGKTTAAIGLAIRALGAGKKVLFLQFMKANSYSEHKILPKISPLLRLETIGKPFFIARKEDMSEAAFAQWQDKCVIFEKGHPPQEYVELIKKGLRVALDGVTSGEYDLVILDEINVVLFYELADLREVIDLIGNKKPEVDLVLTGRNCPQEIIEKSDLVTEMKEIKHYYAQGVQARIGIEN